MYASPRYTKTWDLYAGILCKDRIPNWTPASILWFAF